MVLQQALADLNAAYRNFFASLKGRRKGRQGRAAPVPVPQGPAAGDPVHPQRPVHGHPGPEAAPAQDRGRAGAVVASLPSVPSTVTVIKDAAGRYFASFVVEAGDDAAAGSGRRDRHRPRPDPFRGPVRRPQGRRPRFLRRAERKLRKAQQALQPQGEGQQQPGQGPGRRSPGCTPGGRHAAGTGCTRNPPASSATTKRCTWRTCAWPASPGPGWPSPCTMRAGRRSWRCWSTRPAGTAAPSPGPAGSSRPPRCARPAGPGTAQAADVRTWTCAACGHGPRPGRERGPERARPGAQGGLNACGGRKTSTRAGVSR